LNSAGKARAPTMPTLLFLTAITHLLSEDVGD